jgi:hypothetical protein
VTGWDKKAMSGQGGAAVCQEVAACKLHFLTHSSTSVGDLNAQVMWLVLVRTHSVEGLERDESMHSLIQLCYCK